MDAASAVDAQTAPTAPWKTLRVFHEPPQGILSTKSPTDWSNHPPILLRSRKYIQEGKADLVAFGRKFLSNPDLPQRFKESAALNSDDPTTYYGGGERGYTDYPSLAQERGDEPCGCVDGTAFDAGGPCK